MRQSLLATIAAGAGLVLAAGRAPGALLLTDHFDYGPVDAALAGQTNPSTGGNWGFVGAASGANADPKIAGDSLAHPDRLPGVGNSVKTDRTQSGSSKLPIGATFTSGTIYYSMLVQVSDITNLNNTTTGSFFAGFSINDSFSPAVTSIATAGASLMIHRDPNNASAYNLGVAVTTNNADRVFDTTELVQGQTLFVVVGYEFVEGADNDRSYLWINPPSASFGEGSAPTPTATSDGALSAGVSADVAQLTSFFLRNNGVEPNQILVDDLRVGTTWADVTFIPEPSMATASCLGLLGALGRRRRGA